MKKRSKQNQQFWILFCVLMVSGGHIFAQTHLQIAKPIMSIFSLLFLVLIAVISLLYGLKKQKYLQSLGIGVLLAIPFGIFFHLVDKTHGVISSLLSTVVVLVFMQILYVFGRMVRAIGTLILSNNEKIKKIVTKKIVIQISKIGGVLLVFALFGWLVTPDIQKIIWKIETNSSQVAENVSEESTSEIVVEVEDFSVIATFEPLAENEVLAWEYVDKLRLKIYAQSTDDKELLRLVAHFDDYGATRKAETDTDSENVHRNTLRFTPDRKIGVISGYKNNCFYYIDGKKGKISKIPYANSNENGYRYFSLSNDGRYILSDIHATNLSERELYGVEEKTVITRVITTEWVTNLLGSDISSSYGGWSMMTYANNAFLLMYLEGNLSEQNVGRVYSAAELNPKTGELTQLYDDTTIKINTMDDVRNKIRPAREGSSYTNERWQARETIEATQKANLNYVPPKEKTQ